MLKRWWFAVKYGFAERKVLNRFLVNPAYQIQSLTEITPERLDQAAVAILILDFDGVLANHDAKALLPEVEKWLRALCNAIGEQRIAVLTNKPNPSRLQYFATHFPSIHVVRGVRKKPYPDGILEVANYRGLPPHRVLLVDDRLLTGMLATRLACSQGWYFTKPVTNYWKHPFKEIFFTCLRVLERFAFRWAGSPS
ncbi:MAG: HAD family hydrolase [Candidatus Berkiellales bacterium]